MAGLFPVFDVPKMLESNSIQNIKKKASLNFDFEKGDFKLDTGGRIETASPYDSWVQWCLKTIYTQRWAHVAYSGQTGVETEEALQAETRSEQESAIERTVSEALLADPYKRTKRVHSFNFEWGADSVKITFTVNGVWNEETALTVDLKRK